MLDLKLRDSASFSLKKKRRTSHATLWLVPVLVMGTGGLYAALQLDASQDASGHSLFRTGLTQPVTLPLKLPKPAAAKIKTLSSPVIPRLAHAPVQISPYLRATESAHQDRPPSEAKAEMLSADAAIDDADELAGGRWLSHRIERGENLSIIFRKLGLSAGILNDLVNSGDDAKQLARVQPGQELRVHLVADGELAQLQLQMDPARSLNIVRSDAGFIPTMLEQEVETRTSTLSGQIESSLFQAAQKAGLSDALIMELAEIFGWDIDFALEIQAGDRFSVVYEEDWVDGNKLADGPILAAEFVNQGKTYRAIRFEDEAGRAHYYTPDGHSMRKAFIRAPVDFRRISSGFQRERWHPVLGKKRPHRGVDYAAAIGTPVKASGDGKVLFVGEKSGYGKTVILQHGSQYTTLYAHLSGYPTGIKDSRTVKQGDTIGYVGMTGLATGPHLHYEFRVDGAHRDPLTVKLPDAAPIDKRRLHAFRDTARPLLARLAATSSTVVADAK